MTATTASETGLGCVRSAAAGRREARRAERNAEPPEREHGSPGIGERAACGERSRGSEPSPKSELAADTQRRGPLRATPCQVERDRSEALAPRGPRGNALVLVIIVLAALVAIAAPFALSMRLQEKTSRGFSAGIRAEQAARAARELAVLRLLESHPSYERRAADAAGMLADAPEDWDDAQELAPLLEPLAGATRFEVRDPKGTILAAEVVDEQGKVNLNSATSLLLGNLLGVGELERDVDERAQEFVLAGDAPFYSDGDPETYDGILRIGRELCVYRHIDRTADAQTGAITLHVRGLERGAFFSTPEKDDLVHAKGELVHDARGYKLAQHPFWLEMGSYRPFATLPSAREIASWQLVDISIATLFEKGVTAEILAEYGLGGEKLRAAEARPAAPEAAAPASLEKPPTDLDEVQQRFGRREGRKWLERVGDKAELESGEQRAWIENARERLKRMEEHERAYFPSAAEQASRISDARDLEVLSARELEFLRDLVTVSSGRPAEWAGGALVLNRVEYTEKRHTTDLVLGVDIPEARAGAAARVDLPDGTVHYRRIVQTRRAGPAGASLIRVFPELDGTHEKETLRVFVAPPHAVNVNTAPLRVLEALLTGLERGGQGQAKGVRGDFVTRAEAAAVARRIAAGTLKDLSGLGAVLQAANAAGEISDADRLAIFTNAVDPGSPLLRTHTAPFCFKGGEIATIVSTGIVNDPAGNELARRVFRETVAVAPPRETTLDWDSQQDLLPGYPGQVLLPGRRGNLVETLPYGITSQPPVVALPQVSRSHAPGDGEIRLAGGEAPGIDRWGRGDPSVPDVVEHYRTTPEGRKIEAGRPEVFTTSPIDVTVPYFGRGLVPGHFEVWLRPGWDDGYRVLFDTGPEDDVHNRLCCFYDDATDELVLEVSDAALDRAEPAYLRRGPRVAEIRHPMRGAGSIDRIRFERDRWVHVAAAWRGSKQGDLALFVDGLSVGTERHVTRLSADITAGSAQIPIDDASEFPLRGVVQVGAEVMDYDNTGGQWRDGGPSGSPLLVGLRDVIDQQTGQVTGQERNSRNRPRAHRRGTPVQVYGYTDFLQAAPLAVPPYFEYIPQGLHLTGETVRGTNECLRTPTPKALLYDQNGLTLPPDPNAQPTPRPAGCLGLPADPAITLIQVVSGGPTGSSSGGGPPPAGAGFPDRDGVIQIGRERIRYTQAVPDGNQPDSFIGCQRGFGGTPVEDHLVFENVVLCDIVVTPSTAAYQADAEAVPVIQFSFPSEPPLQDPQPEWVRVLRPTAQDRFYMEHGDTKASAPGLLGGGWRVRLGQGQAFWTRAEVRNFPGLGAPGADYGQWMREEVSRARGIGGTAGRTHGLRENVNPTFRTESALHGRRDWVTITETDQSTREERRVAWSSGGRAAFTSFLPRPYSRSSGARLIKRPSGELPTQVSTAFSVGGRRPDAAVPGPPGWLEAWIDEPRLARDDTTWLGDNGAWGNVSAYGAFFGLGVGWPRIAVALPESGPAAAPITVPTKTFVYAGGQRVPIPDPLMVATQLEAGARTHGLLVKIDDEVMGCTEAGGPQTGTIQITARGLLGTVPAEHTAGSKFHILPFPAIARLQGGLEGPGAELIRTTGVRPRRAVPTWPAILGIDAERGGGPIELLPYDRFDGKAFTRPRDDRRQAAYRGSYGTENDTPLRANSLAILHPFRYHDRHGPTVESDDAVYWQRAFAPAGAAGGSACVFRALEWDEELPHGDVDVVALARVDGKPAWETPPTNLPGGIFRFDDPRAENRIGVAGRSLEVRLVFPFKPGAYSRRMWKDTPRVGAVRVRYLEPVRVLAAEEVR